mmetsp:Transcript_6808/g.25102  ORF Transcript_6808/g.25102 Transcript_6808/m.25102 type:complete len:227 (-) Transcript_6808:764-1444(-)
MDAAGAVTTVESTSESFALSSASASAFARSSEDDDSGVNAAARMRSTVMNFLSARVVNLLTARSLTMLRRRTAPHANVSLAFAASSGETGANAGASAWSGEKMGASAWSADSAATSSAIAAIVAAISFGQNFFSTTTFSFSATAAFMTTDRGVFFVVHLSSTSARLPVFAHRQSRDSTGLSFGLSRLSIAPSVGDAGAVCAAAPPRFASADAHMDVNSNGFRNEWP